MRANHRYGSEGQLYSANIFLTVLQLWINFLVSNRIGQLDQKVIIILQLVIFVSMSFLNNGFPNAGNLK